MAFGPQRQLVLRRHQLTGILTPEAQIGLTTEDCSKSPPLKARINHGRWVVDCECKGAELAWDEGLFMCQSCWNDGHGNQLRRVEYPRNHSKIEAILLVRPIDNRNWYLGESLAKLEAENKAHKEELV